MSAAIDVCEKKTWMISVFQLRTLDETRLTSVEFLARFDAVLASAKIALVLFYEIIFLEQVKLTEPPTYYFGARELMVNFSPVFDASLLAFIVRAEVTGDLAAGKVQPTAIALGDQLVLKLLQGTFIFMSV